MDETRVERYKEYRSSFIKEGAIEFDDSGDETQTIDVKATTSTLDMEAIAGAVKSGEQEKDAIKRANRERTIKLIVKIAIGVLLVVGLIVLGIFAWGK